MKKMNTTVKVIVLFSFIGIILLPTLIYLIIRERDFLKSGFRKKVEKIEGFKSGDFQNINIDCIYFTDGTYTYFTTYSIVDENDTLTNVRIIDYIAIGDSIIKNENEALIRVVKE